MKTSEGSAGIYLDNAATTRPDPAVLQAVNELLRDGTANASALHRPGIRSARAVERARAVIARAIGASPDEIVFTSGGTEANNLALKGTASARRERGRHIIISGVEHPSIDAAASWLETQGFEVSRLAVDGGGFVAPEELRQSLRDTTILVSVIHGQNEIGTIQPIGELGEVCRQNGTLFHTDACQSFTKTGLDVAGCALDMVTLNAHKIHGPQGVGALYVRAGIELDPLLHGGGQERGLRSGTSNVAGIIGFGAAVEASREDDRTRMEQLRDHCIRRLEEAVPGMLLNGPRRRRLCNNINITLPGLSGKGVFNRLNKQGIFLSTGAACSSRTLMPSPVLTAIGRTDSEAFGALRLSLSKWTTRQEIDTAVDALARAAAAEAEEGSDHV